MLTKLKIKAYLIKQTFQTTKTLWVKLISFVIDVTIALVILWWAWPYSPLGLWVTIVVKVWLDRSIWGGIHLLQNNYLVICLTNGNNQTRAKEFYKVMEQTHNTGIILDY